jgi:ribosomal protein S18 acetylase RimI-like enzyme
MKKLLISLLCVSTVFCAQQESACIFDYEQPQKETVMGICFQDPLQFFGGSQLVSNGAWSMEHFVEENKKGMEAIFADPLRVKRVMIESGRVAGFVEFFKTKEQSLESLKRQMNLSPEQEAQIVAMMPNLKKTDAECETFVLLECLAVSRDFRRRGYARALVNDSIEQIKQKWPMATRVQLNVNAANENARKLYESEGFILSAVQPPHLVMMGDVQYEKAV